MISIREELINANRVLITTHKSPDGDAIGSSVFMYHVLDSMGKKPLILIPDEPASFLKSFLSNVEYIVFEDEISDVKSKFDHFDLAVHLDYNAESRVGDEMSTIFEELKVNQIMIDHHPNPTMNCDIMISESNYSSTCELLFDVLEESKLTEKINKEGASACYLGIMTDTGSFRFPSVTSNTHRVIQFLMKKEIEHHLIHEKVHDSKTINQLKLKGYALSQKLEFLTPIKMGIISLSEEELLRFEYKKGDTEGLVNYILSVEGIEIAVFLMQKSKDIKISFRSKGNIFVNDFASKYFNGGGHKYAAGGISRIGLEETLKHLKAKAISYYG